MSFNFDNTDITGYTIMKIILFMSIGTSKYEEALKSIRVVKSAKISVMHCVSIYPGQYEKANMPKLVKMISELNDISDSVNRIGYSDHIVGVDSAKAAIGLGANIIEKHFTTDNNCLLYTSPSPRD